MKFSKERPPVMDKLEKTFNVKWGGSLVVAYGDTIYHSEPLHESVIIHESVHLARQDKPEQWWENYLRDSKFRFGEELLAYREQYKFLKQTERDRNNLTRLLFKLGHDLSTMYGLPIHQQEAIKLIKME